MSDDSELCHTDAVELVTRLRRKELSARELTEACLARIEAVNPRVNAVCTLGAEQAMEAARAADEVLAEGQAPGPLHGLPHLVKDLLPTQGMRTTFASPIYEDHVPEVDALAVARVRAAGGIILGKTNTPEFGAGSHTFNALFGATLNPYDPSRTVGGSSGGSAAALACGMAPLADGTDLGGSLRNPAGYCNVVGFRPSPGRVPKWPALNAWEGLGVTGPMGRTVRDAALLLSVQAGPDPRSPLSIESPGELFRGSLEMDLAGVRVAWTRDLGRYPVTPEVVRVVEEGATVLDGLGCIVEEAAPDLAGADEVFQVLRAYDYAAGHAAEYEAHADLMKDTVRWNVEQGLGLSALDVGRAAARRTEIYHRMRRFMEAYRFLLLPTAQVPPFPVEWDWVREIEGVEMETYIDWMAVCCVITVTGHPAISVPGGFTAEGLPLGLQIVGRHHADMDVLRLAHTFEHATGHGRRRPDP